MSNKKKNSNIFSKILKRKKLKTVKQLSSNDKDDYGTLLEENKSLKQYITEIETLYIINKFANEEDNIINTLQFYLDSICKLCNCTVGHIYLILSEEEAKKQKNPYRYLNLWYLKDPAKFHEFKDQSAKLNLKSKATLPGQVLASASNIFIADLSNEPTLARKELFAINHLKSAIALPIKEITKIIAVAEFFFERKIIDLQRKLYLLNNITIQLNTALEYQRKTKEIKANYQKLLDAQFELKQSTHLDNLTKLPNRRSFEERLQSEAAKADTTQSVIAVLIINLDHFKTINDKFGHHSGDLLLKEATRRLKDFINASDFIARIGSDEYGVILTNISGYEKAEKIAIEMIRCLSTPYRIENDTIAVGASIGIACYPDNNSTNAHLFKNADMAMYSAKLAGRNTYRFFTSNLKFQQSHRSNLENDLRLALENNEFFLEYQPIYNLASGKIAEFEALLRWQHPTQGMIGPDYFIPIAEDTGLIIPIGQWVIQKACQDFASWPNAVNNCKLAINVSSLQLREAKFIEIISNVLIKQNIPPHSLTLEITESIAASHIEDAIEKLNTLQQMGVSLSIDDFGTGYSTLSSLKQFPINNLKIDKSFMKNVNTDQSNALIVQSTIALARDLGLTVIAEGVETEDQVRFLIDNNCPNAQGYYFSYPLKPDKVINLLQTQFNSP